MAEPKDSASARPSPTREDRWQAIRERTTRGMLTYNAGGVVRLEGDLWAVRSATHGGFHRVDLDAETCTCPDFEHYGRANDVCCKHLFAVAIAQAHRRGRRRPCACIVGWVYLGVVAEDGHEYVEAVHSADVAQERARRAGNRAGASGPGPRLKEDYG